jgi:segregation and condensation protein B
MLSDDSLTALIEAIVYVAPEPVSLEMIARSIEGEDRSRIKAALDSLIAEFEKPSHGIHVRTVAGGYAFSSKPEHHEILRSFVKSLKPPIRLSKPALETLAVIAYRQPVTLPEIEEIRGVDCGGVAHTLLEKKLVVTAGRKNVVGRPILYRTSREFLVHFGLKDVGELPSLREFEELARQALGSEAAPPRDTAAGGSAASEETMPPAENLPASGVEGADQPSTETTPEPGPDESASPEEGVEELSGQDAAESGSE